MGDILRFTISGVRQPDCHIHPLYGSVYPISRLVLSTVSLSFSLP